MREEKMTDLKNEKKMRNLVERIFTPEVQGGGAKKNPTRIRL